MTLETHEAVLLGHALVNRASSDAEIRALVIKGPALTAQGLRGEHESADVDVLVDPSKRPDLIEHLGTLGWRSGVVSTAPSILPPHSVTLRHSAWPIEIDVHDRFPGFLADPGTVFEALWERRTSVRLAGVDVLTCDPITHSAVAALHHLRDPAKGSTGPGLDQLVARTRDILGAQGRDELADFAARTGAAETLGRFLERLGVPRPMAPTADAAALDHWRLRTASTGSEPWVLHLTQQPVRRWPRLLWHALMLSDQEIDAFHADPLGRKSRTRLRLRRWRRGLRQLPSAAMALVRVRRQQRSRR